MSSTSVSISSAQRNSRKQTGLIMDEDRFGKKPKAAHCCPRNRSEQMQIFIFTFSTYAHVFACSSNLGLMHEQVQELKASEALETVQFKTAQLG